MTPFSASEFAAAQKAGDCKIRFWLKNAELFSYLPADLDPSLGLPQPGPCSCGQNEPGDVHLQHRPFNRLDAVHDGWALPSG